MRRSLGEGTKYKTAREMSGYIQEDAAEKLFTSISNLRRIESGRQQCKPDMEVAMAQLYKAPWVADRIVPIDYKPIPRADAMLQYINEREDVEKLLPRLRRILADGIICEDEEEERANCVCNTRSADKGGNMKATGIVRRVDELGCVVIPK